MVDRSPRPTDLKLEKTSDSQSQTQRCNIQEINEDNHDQTRKIYHFENCSTVYIDSLNAHDVRMENCGNNVSKVTYHRPRIFGSENVLHSQPHAVSNGPQDATGPPTAPTESNSSNVLLQTNAHSPLQSPQPISPSNSSGDHTHIKYLEQLLDSSLATVAVIQFSGNTLAEVLTPRAYDTFKALYTLAALDVTASSTKPRWSEIPTRPTFSDVGNDFLHSSNRSPPSRLGLRFNDRIHISISVDYVILFSWAGLAAVSILIVFFNLPRVCESGHF